MARYINKFADATAIQNAVDNGELSKPYVAYDISASTIDWNTKSTTSYETQYLTFEIISAGTVYWRTDDELENQKTISYSKDNGNSWTNITATRDGVPISVNAGDKVMFKGINASYGNDNFNYNNFQLGEGSLKLNVYGNIMSLIYGDNFIGQTTLTEPFTFFTLFQGGNIIDASNLALPATTLTNYCYAYLLASTTLISAPQLPATTLATGCYNALFYGCTSLTTAPDLLATTLVNDCYNQMFVNCSNLNYVKCLATDISANGTSYWLYGVASTGTFVKDANMSDWETGDSGIPNNWTVEEEII